MNTKHDALRSGQSPYPNRLDCMLSASPAAPEGAKSEQCPVCNGEPNYDNNPCRLCGTVSNQFTVAARPPHPQPQAQKEPEVVLTVVKENDYWSGGHFHEGKKPTIHSWDVRNIPIGTQLITLQSHREAIAKRDAALVACVEALRKAIDPSRSTEYYADLADINAAITHANEVLGRKEGGI